jgi:hypothetical protein
LFDHFDLDHDRYLSHQPPDSLGDFKRSPTKHEYPFTLDLTKLPPELAFRIRDKNQQNQLNAA